MRSLYGAPLLTLLLCAGPAEARLAWPAREPPVKPGPVHQLRDVESWPAEPDAPAEIDRDRFAVALVHLCGKPTRALPAKVLLTAAADAAVDPFLLAAVAYERSRCGQKRGRDGYGALRLHPRMYLRPGAPAPPGKRRDWQPARLARPAVNLALGAQVLAMWGERHEEIDAAARGVAHRSPVAHLYWGDRVRGTGHEDLVLTARRRLLERYQDAPPVPRDTALGVALTPPLDGAPRVATSGPGEDRDGGARRHKGIDLVALEGEPVRAVAGGIVQFAGVSLPGARRKGPLAPAEAQRYRRRRLGPGGIYLCIRHDDAPDGGALVSCYMHLSSYSVGEGERVEAGQTIGAVGSTGVRNRYAHLHFELRHADRPVDACRFFPEEIIPPRATEAYQRAIAVQRARRTRS